MVDAQNLGIENVATLALRVKQDIVALKKQYLDDLEEELKTYQARLDALMTEEGIDEYEVPGLGKVTIYENHTPDKFNEEELKEALGVKSLKKFKTPGRTYNVVKISPDKK